MKIIPLVDKIYNKFCNVFQKSLTPLNIESNIRDVGDNFTIKLYENFLNFFDEQFKNSKARKANYYVKETRQRTLITSVGSITVNVLPISLNKISIIMYLLVMFFIEILSKTYQRSRISTY